MRSSSAGGRFSPLTLGAFLFAAVLILFRIGDLSLLDPDEGRNAEVAREMARSGDWLIPTYNDLPYLDKPALYFAMVALSLEAFGDTAAAARIPSALCALGLLLIVYLFCRREYGVRAAALAVIVVSSMPLFLALSRFVIFDMPLALFVSGSILAGFRAEQETAAARRRWYLLASFAAAGATLLKGPVGFIIPLLVLGVWALLEKRPAAVRRLFHPWQLLLFFALVLPWFIGVSLRHPDFPYYGLVKESAQRLATEEFDRGGPFYYYLPVMLGVCFAWSVLVPGAIVLAWRQRRRWTSADRLLIVWGSVVVIFFSISQSKLPGYVLSAVVALGMLVARLFDRAWADPRSGAASVVCRGAGGWIIASAVPMVWLILETVNPGWISSLFQIESRDYERSRVFFPGALAVLTLVVLTAGAGLLRRNLALILGAFLLFPVSLLTLNFRALQSYAGQTSSQALAREIEASAPGVPVVLLECYSNGLAFYLRRTPFLVTQSGKETTSNYVPFYLARQDVWPAPVIPASARDAWLERRDGAILVLARKKHRDDLSEIAEREGVQVREIVSGWWSALLPARERF